MKIAIACGGTGGHTFPGLAVGRWFEECGEEVEVLVAGRDVEAATLKGWRGAIFRTRMQKGKKGILLHLLPSVVRTFWHWSKKRPDVLLAMGSYASVPAVVAARLRGIPVVLHEANAIPGKANAFLSRFAKVVATSFVGGEENFHCKEIERTGIPIRKELLEQKPREGYETEGEFVVLVTGGSQGAKVVNQLASEALVKVAKRGGSFPRLRILHQVGGNQESEAQTKKTYCDAGVEAEVVDFIDEMGGAFRVADLVIGRSGASTCSEICLFGKPAIYIPLPIACRDHQYLNAKQMVEKGAAVVVRQGECTPEWLAEQVTELMENPNKVAEMGDAARKLAVSDAVERLAMLVRTVSSK